MKEKEFIEIIKKVLNSKYIGDDCAYLKELGIVITQDSLVEDVHFSMKFMTPYQLGYKSAMVNISDICASGGEPKYLTIALSLPQDTSDEFVESFYKGCKSACGDVEIVGGDITGSDKIFVSVTAIGTDKNRQISSRKNAKIGQKIIVSGNHGSSAAGLKLLIEGKEEPDKFINAHLMPIAQREFSRIIGSGINGYYAMMDTSDGLGDALSAIACDSGVKMSVDFDKIPYDKSLEQFDNYIDMILFGGEDYQLVAIVPDEFLHELNRKKQKDFDYTIIGEVKSGTGVEVKYKERTVTFTKSDIENRLYNHFGEKNDSKL